MTVQTEYTPPKDKTWSSKWDDILQTYVAKIDKINQTCQDHIFAELAELVVDAASSGVHSVSLDIDMKDGNFISIAVWFSYRRGPRNIHIVDSVVTTHGFLFSTKLDIQQRHNLDAAITYFRERKEKNKLMMECIYDEKAKYMDHSLHQTR